MANVIDLAKYVARIELDESALDKGLDNADSKLKDKMGSISNFLKVSIAGGLVAVGTAIAGTIVSGVKATADLEEQLSKFQASTGSTVDEVEGIKDIAQELFKVNTDSMEDIIATSEALKQAMGLSVDEIGKYQQAFMDYAKTTSQNNADVVRAIDDIGDAWNLTTEEMVGSLDMMKLSSERFGTDIIGVQSALNSVAPAAKALGMGLEETNGIMNLLAASGLDAGASVTAFTYAAKTVKSPEEFRKMLADIQAISDPTERAQKAVELFGARAGVAMANVLDGTKNIDDFIVSMDEATGTVANASEAFDSNLNIQIELAKKMFSGLVQELGEKFMPIVNEILQWVTSNIPVIVGYIEDAINFIGTILNPFIELIKAVIGSFGDLNSSTDSNFSTIKETIMSIINAISDFIKAFVDFLKSLWDLLGEDLINNTKVIWENIMGVIKGALKILEGIFKVFSSFLKGDWNGLWEGLKLITSGATDIIKNTIQGFLNIVNTIWDAGWTLIKTVFEGIWNGIYNFIKNIVDSIKNTIFGVIDTVNNAIDKIKEWNIFKPVTHTFKTINESINKDISSYDVGTPFVSSDQLAFIHRGESIIPASMNPFNPANKNLNSSSQGNNFEFKFDSLIKVQGNMLKDILPSAENTAKQTLNWLDKELKKQGR